MLAGQPRKSGLSDYEMDIGTRRADDREEPTGAGGQKSVSWVQRENSSLQSLLKSLTYGADNPRKGHVETSPNH